MPIRKIFINRIDPAGHSDSMSATIEATSLHELYAGLSSGGLSYGPIGTGDSIHL
jgi:hypothetical protein